MARATRTEWLDRVRRWKASGLTAGEFATREGVNAKTLLWWSSELRRDGRRGPKFLDVTDMVATAPDARGLDVLVRDSVRIRVSAGFDTELLRAVVLALESR